MIEKDSEFSFNLREEFVNEKDITNIQFQTSLNIIKLPFVQFFKYSHLAQEYRCDDIANHISEELQAYQRNNNIKEESVQIFFKLLQEESVSITSDHYIDLCKLSDKFKIYTLQSLLKKYAKKNSNNIELLLNLLNELQVTKDDKIFNINEFSSNIESCLSKEINKCLKNKKFGNLAVSTVYRIIEKSDINEIQSDHLLDFISSSIKDRFPLFEFLKVEKLSDEKFSDLYQIYSNGFIEKCFFRYLPVNLSYIKLLKDNIDSSKNRIKSLEDENKKLKDETEKQIKKIQNLEGENTKLSQKNDQLSSENKNLTVENIQSKEQFNLKVNQFELQIKKLEEENRQMKDELKDRDTKFQAQVKKLEDKNKKLHSNQKVNQEMSFPFRSEFQGIINFLKNKSGNIDNEISFSFSSNNQETATEFYGNIHNITLFNDLEKGFFTKNLPDNWICLGFKNYRIIPTDYTIRTCNCTPFLKGWVIEACDNNISWEIIDEQKDCSFLNGRNYFHTFKIINPNPNAFRYIRIRQTQTWGSNYLGICAFEIYGSLI